MGPNWPGPNLALLNIALRQTDWTGTDLGPDNWRQMVGDRLRTAERSQVVSDVRPFLEPTVDAELLTVGNLLRALG